jgi:hypothetical protein
MVKLLTVLLFVSCSALATAQSATPDNEVILVTTINKDQVYVQEELIYSIKLYYRLAFERGAAFSRPEMSESATSRLGESLEYTELIDGVTYAVNENRFVIFPQNSGEFTIAPIKFRAYTSTRNTRDNPDLLTTKRRELIELESNAHQLRVLPVPAAFPGMNWLPSTEITLSETWSAPLENLQIGDAVVRSIHVKAEDLFSSMLLNLDFTADSSMRTYPTAPEQVDIRENVGTRSEHIQNITLVATEAGPLTLPEIVVPWWNTQSNQLEYARLPAHNVDILTAAGERLTPQTESESETNPTRLYFGLNLNLILFIGMLVLVSALFFAPALVIVAQKTRRQIDRLLYGKKTPQLREVNHQKLLKKRYHTLLKTCEKQDLKACYEGFLAWGQVYFQDKNLYSLDRLTAAFADTTLNLCIASMKCCLFGDARQADFDFRQFSGCISALQEARKQSRGKQFSTELPPLYPH